MRTGLLTAYTKIDVAYTCLHHQKAYGSVKLKAYDNYIKSNREEAENRRPLCSVHSHRTQQKPGYIKTNKIVDADHIFKDNEPTDPVANEYCSMLVRQYTDRLNRANTTLWSVSEIIEYLLKTDEEVCFSDLAVSLLNCLS